MIAARQDTAHGFIGSLKTLTGILFNWARLVLQESIVWQSIENR